MLTLNKEGLFLMHPVRINKSLSKYSDNEDNVNEEECAEEKFFQELINEKDSFSMLFYENNYDDDTRVYDGIPFQFNRNIKSELVRRIYTIWLKSKIFFNKIFNKRITDEEFFELIKSNDNELKGTSDEELKKILSEVKKIKFQNVKNKIVDDIRIKCYENELIDNGFNVYISEKDLVSFVKMTNGGISLIEIEYFEYEIPNDVLTQLEKAEKLKIFDNYYILYKLKDFSLNKTIDNATKDPILFGVIRESNKLYFIADWLTDYCDLTLDYVTDKLGKGKSYLEKK